MQYWTLAARLYRDWNGAGEEVVDGSGQRDASIRTPNGPTKSPGTAANVLKFKFVIINYYITTHEKSLRDATESTPKSKRKRANRSDESFT